MKKISTWRRFVSTKSAENERLFSFLGNLLFRNQV